MAEENRLITFSKASFGGYRPEEVDEYVDNVNVRLDAQQNRISELTEKMRYLVRVIEQMRSDGVPVPADAEAIEKAEALVREAQQKADQIIAEAKEKADQMIAQVSRPNSNTVQTGFSVKSSGDITLDEVREKTLQTVDTIAKVCSEEANKFQKLREQLLINLTQSEDSVQTRLEPQNLNARKSKDTSASGDLNLDEGGFAELREGISALAEEKYIPGQEDPTIVPTSIRDIRTKPVDRFKSGRQSSLSQKNATDEKKDGPDEQIRFSLFRK